MSGQDYEQLTLFQEDSPASLFPWLESKKGKDDDRYLWPEMLRVIRELAPTWVIGENVPGILRLAAGRVVQDLERAGYNVVVLDFEAAAVGAPHRRERIAFVANCHSDGGRERRPESERQQRKAGVADGGNALADTDAIRRPEIRHSFEERHDRNQEHFTVTESQNVANAGSAGLQGQQQHGTPDTREWEQEPCGSTGKCGEAVPDAESQRSDRPEQFAEPAGRTRLKDRGWWAIEPDVGRVANGIPHRVDRLRCLGNAVVPQQFYPIFRAIAEIEGDEHDR